MRSTYVLRYLYFVGLTDFEILIRVDWIASFNYLMHVQYLYILFEINYEIFIADLVPNNYTNAIQMHTNG